MAGSVEEIVKNAISSDDVVIFSKSRCPFCTRVKELFEKKNQAFTAVEIDNMPECSEIQGFLQELTGARTVPRVFIRGECYGGCDDIMKLEKSGQLSKILKK